MSLTSSPIICSLSPPLKHTVSSPRVFSKVFVHSRSLWPVVVGSPGRRGRMTPHHSGNTSSSSKSAVEYHPWSCYFGFTTHAKPASTWKNFSRMFYGCPNYKNHGCNYFEWCDPPMCIYGRRSVNKFRDMHGKIESEVVLVRRREKMLITAVGVLAVLLFAVILKLVIK